MPNPEDLIDGVLKATPLLLAAAHPGRRVCVLGTRVVIETLSYFGVTARPWTCRVVVLNEIAAVGFLQGRPWPDIFADGGMSIGQGGSGGFKEDGVTWDGHLVALVDDWPEGELTGTLLVDSSFKDYARPHLGIHTFPLRATVPREMITKRVVLPLEANGIAMYEPIQSDLWRTAPDWVEESRWRPIVGELVRMLR